MAQDTWLNGMPRYSSKPRAVGRYMSLTPRCLGDKKEEKKRLKNEKENERKKERSGYRKVQVLTPVHTRYAQKK